MSAGRWYVVPSVTRLTRRRAPRGVTIVIDVATNCPVPVVWLPRKTSEDDEAFVNNWLKLVRDCGSETVEEIPLTLCPECGLRLPGPHRGTCSASLALGGPGYGLPPGYDRGRKP